MPVSDIVLNYERRACFLDLVAARRVELNEIDFAAPRIVHGRRLMNAAVGRFWLPINLCQRLPLLMGTMRQRWPGRQQRLHGRQLSIAPGDSLCLGPRRNALARLVIGGRELSFMLYSSRVQETARLMTTGGRERSRHFSLAMPRSGRIFPSNKAKRKMWRQWNGSAPTISW